MPPETEFEKLEKAVDVFAEKMKEKLREKCRQGFTGWDSADPVGREILFRKFLSHVESQCNGVNEWVDLANFCMFLERIEREREKDETTARP